MFILVGILTYIHAEPCFGSNQENIGTGVTLMSDSFVKPYKMSAFSLNDIVTQSCIGQVVAKHHRPTISQCYGTQKDK